jgi:hypothetical protein
LQRAGESIGAFSSLLEHRPEAVKTLVVAAQRYREVGPRKLQGELAAPASGTSLDLQDEGRRAISAALGVGPAEEDGWQSFRLELEIAEGWHVNAPSGDGTSPHLRVLGDGAEIRHLEWPAAKWKRLAGSFEATRVYEGRIVISGGLRAPSAPPGRVILEFQPCDESRCLPATSIALDLESAVERAEDPRD